MEFIAAGWCTRKWLRLDQTIRNLTSGDLGIPPEMMQLEACGLKKTEYLLDFFEERKEKEQCDLVCVCIVLLDDRVVLVLWEVGPILRNGCRI